MLGTSASFLSVPGFILGIFGLVGILAALWIYFKAGTGQALIQQQDLALKAQETRLDEQEKQIAALVKQNQEQGAQIEALIKRNDDLREMVTQAAKVDALIRAVEDGFNRLEVKVKVEPA